MSERPLEQIVRRLRDATQSPRSEDLTDRELLKRFAAKRDDLAFAELVRRHGPMVLRVCARTLRDSHRAEDAFQATFLVLSRKAASLRRPELLSNWLYGVAFRVSREARSRSLRNQRHERRLSEMRDPKSSAPVDGSELAGLLDEELNRLPQKYRTAFVLCHLEGKTHEQAATALRCPVGSMSWRLERARELLRQRLMRRGVTLTAALTATALTADATSAALPAPLLATTVRAALAFATGGSGTGLVASAEVVALARHALRGLAVGKYSVAAVFVVLGLAGVGSASLIYRAANKRVDMPPLAGATQPPAPVLANTKPPRKGPVLRDAFGDPLPEGARARLGTLRYHYPDQGTPRLTFTADGKELLTAGQDGVFIRWDASTGKQLLRINASHGGTDGLAFSADGRFIAFPDATEIPIWDTHSGAERYKIPTRELSLVALSPDGSVLACMDKEWRRDSGEDHFLVLWDVASRAPLQRIPWDEQSPGLPPVLNEQPRLLVFSPDGKTLVTVARTIRFWEVASGKQQRAMKPLPGARILGAAYSPDGKLFAAWETRTLSTRQPDDVLMLWDADTGEPCIMAQDLRRLNDFVLRHGLAFSKDGKTLMSAGQGMVRLWNVATGTAFRSIEVPEDLEEFALDPDGQTVACTGHDNVLHRFAVQTGREKDAIEFVGAVRSVAFSPDSKTIVSAHTNVVEGHPTYALHLWDVSSGRERRTLGRRGQALSDVTFSRDGRTIAAMGPTDLVLWDAASGAERWNLHFDLSYYGECAFSDDGKILYARGLIPVSAPTSVIQSKLRAWEAESGRLLFERLYDEEPTATGQLAGFSAAAKAFVSPQGVVRRLPDLKQRCVLEAPDPKLYHQYFRPAFSVDGRFFAACVTMSEGDIAKGHYVAGRSEVAVWEMASGQIVRRLAEGANRVSSEAFAFSPNGKILAGAGSEAVRLWDLSTGRKVWEREGPGTRVTALAVSPDGATLATGLHDSTVLLWDIRSATESARKSTKQQPRGDR